MSSPRKHLETERFSLRPLNRDHTGLLVELYTDEEVMRYVSGKPYTRRNAEASAARTIEFEESRQSLGVWAIHGRREESVHGWVALQRLGVEEIEVGFRIRRPCWGMGVATEAGRRLVDYAFEDLRLPHVVAIAWAANTESCRVIEKLGLRLEREYVKDAIEWRKYRLDHKDWLALGRQE